MTLWTPNNWQKEHFWPTFSIYFSSYGCHKNSSIQVNNRTENKSANRKKLEKNKNQNKGIYNEKWILATTSTYLAKNKTIEANNLDS